MLSGMQICWQAGRQEHRKANMLVGKHSVRQAVRHADRQGEGEEGREDG